MVAAHLSCYWLDPSVDFDSSISEATIRSDVTSIACRELYHISKNHESFGRLLIAHSISTRQSCPANTSRSIPMLTIGHGSYQKVWPQLSFPCQAGNHSHRLNNDVDAACSYSTQGAHVKKVIRAETESLSSTSLMEGRFPIQLLPFTFARFLLDDMPTLSDYCPESRVLPTSYPRSRVIFNWQAGSNGRATGAFRSAGTAVADPLSER